MVKSHEAGVNRRELIPLPRHHRHSWERSALAETRQRLSPFKATEAGFSRVPAHRMRQVTGIYPASSRETAKCGRGCPITASYTTP
jgi:hypothetical protein